MAIVNAIKKVRKHLEILIDGERICITKSTFRERPLEEGQEIDIDDYKQFVLLHQYKPALTHAADLLAAKGYAEKELERTLVRGGYLQETAEMVVTKLKTLGLLNDQLYAETYLDSRSGAGYGVNRMKHIGKGLVGRGQTFPQVPDLFVLLVENPSCLQMNRQNGFRGQSGA